MSIVLSTELSQLLLHMNSVSKIVVKIIVNK